MSNRLQRAVGARIAAIRKARRLTQLEVARRAGITRPYLSVTESVGSNLSLDTLELLAAALGVGLSEIFTELDIPGEDQS